METPNDFRASENQLGVRGLVKEIDRLVFGDSDLSPTQLKMALAVLAATMSEALRRLQASGEDA